MKEIGIGLLGFGTVGAGVVEGLLKNGDLMAQRLGVKLVFSGIADLDLNRDRGVAVDRALLTCDAEGLIRDPKTDIVVELVGGCGAARKFTALALNLGKPVVTANKALLAEHGDELFSLSKEKNADLYFEASVGGGIPIIQSLRDGLVANRIRSIYGILNGTCNYILTRMERDKLPFDEVLREAQRAGYAEAEPGLDIDGIDTAHKTVILATLAYGSSVPMKAVHVEGIRDLSSADIENARELGYRIKLLGIVHHEEGQHEVRVHPVLVPLNHMLAGVDGVFNAILVDGDIVGETLYYGRGAGRAASASAVLSDLADAALRLTGRLRRRQPIFALDEPASKLRPMGRVRTRYYLRLTLLDRPGVLARVAQLLGEHDISIASVMQKESHQGQHVPVVIVTHEAREEGMNKALAAINAGDFVGAPAVRLRIEDLNLERK